MRSESVCCKSLEILENRIEDHFLSTDAICECFKAMDSHKQVLVNENLLEVQPLCGPHVPYSISIHSDCLQSVSIPFFLFGYFLGRILDNKMEIFVSRSPFFFIFYFLIFLFPFSRKRTERIFPYEHWNDKFIESDQECCMACDM